MASTVTVPSLATVTRWTYPSQFGVRVLIAPPAPAALFITTTAGPNFEGSIDGALLTPALVPDATDEDGTAATLAIASVTFNLTAGDISSAVKIGVLPYRGV
jgi:hypothetical protein